MIPVAPVLPTQLGTIAFADRRGLWTATRQLIIPAAALMPWEPVGAWTDYAAQEGWTASPDDESVNHTWVCGGAVFEQLLEAFARDQDSAKTPARLDSTLPSSEGTPAPAAATTSPPAPAVAPPGQPRPPSQWLTTKQACAVLGLSRDTLDRMVREAPPNLPGAPINVGAKGGKQRLRWDPSRLQEWHTAYGSWRSGLMTPEKMASPQRKPRKPRKAARVEPGRGKLTLEEINAVRQGR